MTSFLFCSQGWHHYGTTTSGLLRLVECLDAGAAHLAMLPSETSESSPCLLERSSQPILGSSPPSLVRFLSPKQKPTTSRIFHSSLVAGCTTGSPHPRCPTFRMKFLASTCPITEYHDRLFRFAHDANASFLTSFGSRSSAPAVTCPLLCVIFLLPCTVASFVHRVS